LPSSTICFTDISQCIQLYENTNITTTVTPTWSYSYQCSSSLLANYLPVLVISVSITGLIIPMSKLILLSVPWSFIKKYAPAFLFVKYFKYSIFGDPLECDCLADGSEIERNLFFMSNRLMSTQLLNMAIVATFGLASPLLSLLLVIGILIVEALWRVLIGRYVILIESLSQEKTACSRLDAASVRSTSRDDVTYNLPIVYGAVAIFWSFQVFDMVADVYGAFAGGMTVLATLVSMSIPVSPFIELLRKSSVETNSSGAMIGRRLSDASDVWRGSVEEGSAVIQMIPRPSDIGSPIHSPQLAV
jgi:hypothetical protein